MMMRLVFLCLAAILLSAPAAAQRSCDRITGFAHTAPTGPVEIVPGIANQRVYPCGFALMQKGQTLDFQMFSADAGSNCAAGITAFSPVFSIPLDAVVVNRLEHVGPGSALGQSLCIHTTGNGSLSGAIYWAQF